MRDLSLGRACHVVQLALAKRQLLGYRSGNLVPYMYSESREKELRAAEHRACAEGAESECKLADWETTRRCIEALLETAPANLLTVSNIKRLFRSQFQVELSETFLGHSKLQGLLQDPRLGDVCRLRLHGHGHAIVKAPESRSTEESPRGSDSHGSKTDSPRLGSDSSHSTDAHVKNTFIHVAQEPERQPGLAQRRALSEPRNLGCDHSLPLGSDPHDGHVKNTFIHVSQEPAEFPRADLLLVPQRPACDSPASTCAIIEAPECETSSSDAQPWICDVEEVPCTPGQERREQLRAAGRSVVSQVWGSHPWVSPLGEAELWRQFPTSPNGTNPLPPPPPVPAAVDYVDDTEGSWEFQGFVAVHVWRPQCPSEGSPVQWISPVVPVTQGARDPPLPSFAWADVEDVSMELRA